METKITPTIWRDQKEFRNKYFIFTILGSMEQLPNYTLAFRSDNQKKGKKLSFTYQKKLQIQEKAMWSWDQQ